MSPKVERRLLQAAVAMACLVPLSAGGAGVLEGPAMLGGIDAAPVDLDSHYRYLSGLLLGIGIGLACCIPSIERRTLPFRTFGALAVMGGFARLLSALQIGLPGPGHVFGLAMELGTVPLLMLWQGRVAGRCRDSAATER